MAFKTPIDYGFAQVIDNSGLVNAYAQQQLANQKAKQAREKEMADQLAKIKPDGIKEADIPEIETRYKNLQGLYHKAASSNSLKDKAEYDAGVRQMMYDIEKSKNSQALYADRLKFYGEHSDDKQLDPDYMVRINAIKDIPTFSKDYATVTNDLERIQTAAPTVDLKKDFDAILKDSEVTNTIETPIGGGRFRSDKVTAVDPMTVANKIVARGVADKNYNKQLFTNYYDAFHDTDRVKDVAEAKQRGFKGYDPSSLSNYVALQVLRTAKPMQKDTSSKGTPKTIINNNINTANQVEIGDAVKDYPLTFTNEGEIVNGKPTNVEHTVRAYKGLNLNIPSRVNVTEALDAGTGKVVSINGALNGDILGIYEMPIYKPTGGFQEDKNQKYAEGKGLVAKKDKVMFVPRDGDHEGKTLYLDLSRVPIDKVSVKKYRELGVNENVREANKEASKQNTQAKAAKQEVPTQARVKNNSQTKSSTKTSGVPSMFTKE